MNGSYEWVHFVERLDKKKENVYRGDVKHEAELLTVVDIMNRNLTKIFGPLAEMKPGQADFYSAFGKITPTTDLWQRSISSVATETTTARDILIFLSGLAE